MYINPYFKILDLIHVSRNKQIFLDGTIQTNLLPNKRNFYLFMENLKNFISLITKEACLKIK